MGNVTADRSNMMHSIWKKKKKKNALYVDIYSLRIKPSEIRHILFIKESFFFFFFLISNNEFH